VRLSPEREQYDAPMNFVHKFAYRVSKWNRTRKWRRFHEELGPTQETSVLDVGFQDAQLQSADNFLEENYEWPSSITALGIEEPIHFSKRYPEVKVVIYAGRDFPFPENSFDIVWSNAVLEHVGDYEAQIHFLRELARVGKRMFITTPNRHFPIEVHTRLPLLHWLPKDVFDSILRRLGMHKFAGGYMRLLDIRELRRMLTEAGITEAKIVRNRLGGPTLDFVIIT
jgi:SAM-dependent methyltransferase